MKTIQIACVIQQKMNWAAVLLQCRVSFGSVMIVQWFASWVGQPPARLLQLILSFLPAEPLAKLDRQLESATFH